MATSTQKGTGFQSSLSSGTFGDWVPERTTFSPQNYCATQNSLPVSKNIKKLFSSSKQVTWTLEKYKFKIVKINPF